jgi:hypothetical protein
MQLGSDDLAAELWQNRLPIATRLQGTIGGGHAGATDTLRLPTIATAGPRDMEAISA